MSELMLSLINYLVDTFGIANLSKPKKQGAKGFMIFNPSTFDVDRLTSLANAVGWKTINKTSKTPHPDKAGEFVDPHLYIGPTSGGFNERDDVLDYAMSCIEE